MPEPRVVGTLTATYGEQSGQDFGPSGAGLVTSADRPIGVNPGNEDVAGTLPSNAQGGQRTTDISAAYVCGATVRRLTPLECERLMGFPDGWTDIPWNKKDHAPDSRRYAACGNGVVAPVAYWIGARLAEVLK